MALEDIATWVAIIGGSGLAGAGVTAWVDSRRTRTLRAENREDVMGRYRDPLLWAAFDLQSRIWHIIGGDFLIGYLDDTEEDRRYAARSTAFALAQYLCWGELLRRGVQFLDLGRRERNQQLVGYLWRINGILSRHDLVEPSFRLFRAKQRGIGEVMIDRATTGVSREERYRLAPYEQRCIGYAAFCHSLDSDEEFSHWFAPLIADVHVLIARPELRRHPRLIDLHNALIDFIDFLDPDHVRFPTERRSRLVMGSGSHDEVPSG